MTQNNLINQIVEVLKKQSDTKSGHLYAPIWSKDFEDIATEIASLHPMNKLREEVERLRDEAEIDRAMFARDCNPNYAYQSIGAKEACNHILSLLTQENDGKAFEEAVEEYVLDIMKNNYPKFLSYALSLIGKEIYKTNADEFTFSQEADLAPNQRYKIEMKGTIKPLPSPPKSKNNEK